MAKIKLAIANRNNAAQQHTFTKQLTLAKNMIRATHKSCVKMTDPNVTHCKSCICEIKAYTESIVAKPVVPEISPSISQDLSQVIHFTFNHNTRDVYVHSVGQYAKLNQDVHNVSVYTLGKQMNVLKHIESETTMSVSEYVEQNETLINTDSTAYYADEFRQPKLTSPAFISQFVHNNNIKYKYDGFDYFYYDIETFAQNDEFPGPNNAFAHIAMI